jgi:hypothetical protein
MVRQAAQRLRLIHGMDERIGTSSHDLELSIDDVAFVP